MRGAVYFALAGLVVVGLSALPPEHGRWVALSLLALIVVTPARTRRVQPSAEDGGKLTREKESSDWQ